MEYVDLFLDALKCSLHDKTVAWEQNVTQEQWEALFQLAVCQNVLPLFFDAVYPCAKNCADADLIDRYSRLSAHTVASQTYRTAQFLSLYDKITQSGIYPLVVKGTVCRNTYPQSDFRPSGDEDLFVRGEDLPALKEKLESLGYHWEETEGEVCCKKGNGQLTLEVHDRLFPTAEGVLRDLESLFTNAHTRSIIQEIDGVALRTMAHTDHFLYLICHAYKHFIFRGLGIRQVCDILQYAKVYADQIQWQQVYENCCAIHADVFAAALFQIGIRHLGVDMSQFYADTAWCHLEINCGPLLDDLLGGGVFGTQESFGSYSATITSNALSGRKGSSLWSALFPPLPYMAEKRHYLRKWPILLPFAWGARICKKIPNLRHRRELAAALRRGSERAQLLKYYGIAQ